jgi:signal transduction histidine kinase
MHASFDPAPAPKTRWQRFAAATVRGFHAYAAWLVSISWWRFWLLAILLLIGMGIVHDLPPFTWKVTEHVTEEPAPKPPRSTTPPVTPQIRVEPPAPGASAPAGVNITIDERGIRITPRTVASAPQGEASAPEGVVAITLPPGIASDAVREAIEQAARDIEEAAAQARRDAEQARQAAEQAARDAEESVVEDGDAFGQIIRVTHYGIGDGLMQLTLLWIVASMIVKITYKGRIQAETKAAQATETAEAETLKRQVVEARMAAMQAQVEPHFLFNTLASIDHLIEVDPKRASQMQKNLIALLRASMPTMREASDGGVRELGRELAVIRPYLEILKVRMEDRLHTEVSVPDGLLSAEFPPMMLQTLVENAIKHGLEPKPEGGSLAVRAEIVHGKLSVSVADTGLGFGKAPTAGTGVGLANIRERLQLRYGDRARLVVAENPGGGTVVTVTVPYKMVGPAAA